MKILFQKKKLNINSSLEIVYAIISSRTLSKTEGKPVPKKRQFTLSFITASQLMNSNLLYLQLVRKLITLGCFKLITLGFSFSKIKWREFAKWSLCTLIPCCCIYTLSHIKLLVFDWFWLKNMVIPNASNLLNLLNFYSLL